LSTDTLSQERILNKRDWWLEPAQQATFPLLSRMALDLLSIPAMSADPERLFSGAKHTLDDTRNRLQDDVIEALESLKSWLGFDKITGDAWVAEMVLRLGTNQGGGGGG